MIQTEVSVRSGTTTEWADADASDNEAAPVLGVGELGIDTTKGQVAVGDGTSTMAQLLTAGGLRKVKVQLVTLVAGTKVTADTSITANTVILPVYKTLGTVTAAKLLTVARSAGVSFTVTSTDNTDTSTLQVITFEP